MRTGESQGICERITKPRIAAAATGLTSDGEPVGGSYLGTTERETRREFMQVGFAADGSLSTVAKRKQLVALIDGLPMSLVTGDSKYVVSPNHAASVLFDEQSTSEWLEALKGQSHIERFVICTASQTTFKKIRDEVESLLGPIIKVVDEGEPMSDGFEENVEFFTLTYENPALVELDLAFERIAPLLWMRAGSQGRRIDERTDSFDVADTYAVLFDVDASKPFLEAVEKAEGLRIAFIVTDDETQYQAVAGQLPEDVESVRLYESYLRTFQINTERN